MGKIFTIEWFKAAAIRAVRTMAQTALAMIPVAVSITEVNWLAVLGTAALAGVCSLLTSLAGLPEVNNGPDCSLTWEEFKADQGTVTVLNTEEDYNDGD